jgi:ABC-type microcin C transport system permease subunit YejB
MQSPKQHVLEQIMSLMDEQMFSRLKKKGAKDEVPAEMSVTVEADAMPEEGAAPKSEEGLDPDSLKKLMEMYGNEDDTAAEPVEVTGSAY